MPTGWEGKIGKRAVLGGTVIFAISSPPGLLYVLLGSRSTAFSTGVTLLPCIGSGARERDCTTGCHAGSAAGATGSFLGGAAQTGTPGAKALPKRLPDQLYLADSAGRGGRGSEAVGPPAYRNRGACSPEGLAAAGGARRSAGCRAPRRRVLPAAR